MDRTGKWFFWWKTWNSDPRMVSGIFLFLVDREPRGNYLYAVIIIITETLSHVKCSSCVLAVDLVSDLMKLNLAQKGGRHDVEVAEVYQG
jgi:hypothetical protein